MRVFLDTNIVLDVLLSAFAIAVVKNLYAFALGSTSHDLRGNAFTV